MRLVGQWPIPGAFPALAKADLPVQVVLVTSVSVSAVVELQKGQTLDDG